MGKIYGNGNYKLSSLLNWLGLFLNIFGVILRVLSVGYSSVSYIVISYLIRLFELLIFRYYVFKFNKSSNWNLSRSICPLQLI